MPLFGLNWRSALAVAAIFGVLHLGSGRRYSFAIWYFSLFILLLQSYIIWTPRSFLSSLAKVNPSRGNVFRATFVGFAYGAATLISSSIIVPMASHSLNNLVGGLLWRLTSINPKERDKWLTTTYARFLFDRMYTVCSFWDACKRWPHHILIASSSKSWVVMGWFGWPINGSKIRLAN